MVEENERMLIVPPVEIRSIVDKTAEFVSKNGRAFERKISNDLTSQKFSFLRPSDPYHLYYQKKLQEAAEVSSAPAPADEQEKTAPPPPPQIEKDKIIINKKAVESSVAVARNQLSTTNEPPSTAEPATEKSTVPVVKKLEPPEEEEFKLNHPDANLTAIDYDVIRLTAQYTAISGKSFLSGLATRELRNPQFDFLKPTHLLFTYFTALVESYSKILTIHQQMKQGKQHKQMLKLQNGLNRLSVLDKCAHRLDWMRIENEKKEREKVRDEKERVAFLTIDWHDFVVVETITFNDDEDEEEAQPEKQQSLPPPPPAKEENKVVEEEMEMDVEDPAQNEEEDEEASEDEDKDDEVAIKVVENYVPNISGQGTNSGHGDVVNVDGKTIKSSEVNEHMRILLMNPKYREETQKHLEKKKDVAYAPDQAIASNLKRFAGKRADIFASSAEEEKMFMEQQNKPPSPSSAVPTSKQEQNDTQYQAAMASQENIQFQNIPLSSMSSSTLAAVTSATLIPQNQIPPPPPPPSSSAQHHAVPPPPPQNTMFLKTGVPPPPPPPPSGIGLRPPPPPPSGIPTAPSSSIRPRPLPTEQDNSSMKRQRLLMPEAEFARECPDPIKISIAVPNDAANKLAIQMLNIEMDIMATVKQLKLKIASLLNLPPNKFQLKAPIGFVKDSLSLAHYNFSSATTLQLTIRQRGGRR